MVKSYRINCHRTSSCKPYWLLLTVMMFVVFLFGVAQSAHAVSYTDLIWNASVSNNVSPYFLASRIRQEVCVGANPSGSVAGTTTGYTGIYNFYNIGATNSGNPVANGLSWASSGTTYGRPWTDPQKSISGGASFLAETYIKVGQDSKYLQKFNVAPSNPSALYTHQYMTNIAAPMSEANMTYNAYNSVAALNLGMVFYIPVYNAMPTLLGTTYTVMSDGINVRTAASTTTGSVITSLRRGSNVQVIASAGSNGGYNWVQVMLGSGITGYIVQSQTGSSNIWISPVIGGSGADILGFPTAYQSALKALRAKHPNWSFVALPTGLDWNTSVKSQLGGKSAVPASGSGALMIEQPATWVETGTWYRASEAAVAYYMNPCNFLSEVGIFQFEQLSFNAALHTQAGVQALLAGTFMAGNGPITYVDINGNVQILGNEVNSTPATPVGNGWNAYEETNAFIKYSTGWNKASASAAYGGAVQLSGTKGSTATFTFTGDAIEWVGVKAATYGTATVTLDGVNQGTVNLRTAATYYQQALFHKEGLDANKTHTIVITVSSPLVCIDRFMVRGTAGASQMALAVLSESNNLKMWHPQQRIGLC